MSQPTSVLTSARQGPPGKGYVATFQMAVGGTARVHQELSSAKAAPLIVNRFCPGINTVSPLAGFTAPHAYHATNLDPPRPASEWPPPNEPHYQPVSQLGFSRRTPWHATRLPNKPSPTVASL